MKYHHIHITLLAVLMLLAPAVLRAQDNETFSGGWGIGFQLGAGGMLPTGSLGDDLKGCALFTGGINAEYGGLRFKADVAFGQPSFKNDNPYHVIDATGRDLQLNATANPTLLGLGVQAGYTVLRRGKFSITPCAGINVNRISWDLNDIKWEKPEGEAEEKPTIAKVNGTHENSLGWMASVDFDIRLKGKIIDAPIGDGNAHYTSSLRITPFVASASYGNLNPSARGACLGIAVTYAGFLRMLNY